MHGPDPASAAAPSTPRLRRGMSLSAGSFALVQVVLLVQTIVAARLLSPAEIGVFAAGTVLSVFLVQASEGGLRSALVQRGHGVQEAANTVFWVTAATGAALSLVSLAAAPLVGAVFDDGTAGAVAAATAATLLVSSLRTVPDGLLQRRLDFRRQAVLDPAVALTNAAATIVLAAAGWGVWSLVAASYLSLGVWVVTGWVLTGWRPDGPPRYRVWRELASFGFPLFLDGMAIRLRDLAETALVGRWLDAAALGNYRYGRRFALLPGSAVVAVCSYVLFPVFSRIADDTARLRAVFLRSLSLLWLVSVPVAGLVLALGQPAVVLVLGEEWRAAGVLVAAMAGFGLGEALNAVGGEALKGVGRSDLLALLAVVGVVLGIGLLLVLLPLGLLGVGIAVSGTTLAVGALDLHLARRVIAIPWSALARLLLPPLLAGGAAVGVVAPLEHALLRSDGRGVAGGLAVLLAEAVLLVLVYAGVLRVVAPAQLRTLRRGLRGGAGEAVDR